MRSRGSSPILQSQQTSRSSRRPFVSTSAASHHTPTQASIWTILRGKVKEINDDEDIDGPRFRPKDLTQEEITQIFGPGVPQDVGNRVLRFQQHRRVEGMLSDDSDSSAHDLTKRLAKIALAWLREKYPVDEEAAYQARVERLERRTQEIIIADAEKMGIYRPQAGVKGGDVYGKSGLDEIREEYQRRAEERAKRRAEQRRQAEEVKRNTGALQNVAPKAELSACCLWSCAEQWSMMY